MATASLGSSWTTAAGTKTVTATPTAADQIVVIVGQSGTTSTPTVSDNNSDGLGTYTLVKSALQGGSTARLMVFVRNAPIGSATSTVFTAAIGGDSGGGLNVIRTTGVTRGGSSAMRASGIQDNVASGTPGITLDQAPLTANAMVGAVITGTNGTANGTPPTSWTEGIDLGYSGPAQGIETVFRDTGHTSTSVTWGAASPSAFGSVAVEIDRSAAPVAETFPYVGGGYYP